MENNFYHGTVRMHYVAKKMASATMSRADDLKIREVVKLNAHYHEEMYKQMFHLENFDYSFTVVRNPINRLISDYFYHKKLGYDHRTLDAYCNHLKNARKNGNKGIYGHLRTQQEFIGTTIKNIYRYEDGFESITRSLSQHLPEVEHFKVPHMNPSYVPYDPVELWESCSEHSKTIVEVVYGEDFKNLNYDFKPEPNNVRD